MLEKFKLLVIISLIFLLIGISFEKRDNRITDLEVQIIKANEERKLLHAYLEELETELESIDKIYREENTLMWHSIGIMRSNFVALGLGFHLEEKDICPEEEKECEEDYEEDSDFKG
jgi:hypothetical protein